MAAEPSFEVHERASHSKSRDPALNEDVVVETPVLVAVIDGATSKHDERSWSFDGEPCSSGVWAARTVARALQDVGPAWTARQAVDHLTDALARGGRAAHGVVPPEQLPAASFAAVHGPRGQLWAVGDCQWLIDGQPGPRGKRVDVVAADLRAAVHAALAAGATLPGEDDDPGRAVILPFLRIQQTLAGTAGEFGYGCLDGRPVLEQHLMDDALPPGAQVVLATDGYPELHVDLDRTERALREALREDPLCVGRLRGTKGLVEGANSFDDRSYVRLRLTGEAAASGVPAQRAAAPDLSLVLDAVERFDFVAVRRKVDALDLPRHVVQPVRRLAHVGQLLLDLDLEDLHRPPAVAEPLRSRLRQVCLPQSPADEPSGLLASLVPATDLVLDVIAVRYEQDDVGALLTAVHLLHEAMPLLAWESVLGHAGDPVRLNHLAARRDSKWGRRGCPSTGPGPKAARGLAEASRDDDSWQRYLERSWSLLGAQLTDCAGCNVPCAVGGSVGEQRDDLRRRLALRGVLGRSALLGLRHGSTVGHAFAIPGREEVDTAWRQTRAQLGRLAPAVEREDRHPLSGLRALVGLVAGVPIHAAGLLCDVRLALRLQVLAMQERDGVLETVTDGSLRPLTAR